MGHSFVRLSGITSLANQQEGFVLAVGAWPQKVDEIGGLLIK